MRILTGDECGLLKEFVPEIAQRKLAKEKESNPKKSDVVLPVHYDRMQNINHQHGMKRVDPQESQTRVRAVVDMTLWNAKDEQPDDFSFATLRANGSVELWQSQGSKLNQHASYQRLSLSADIFETAKDKSPIPTVPVKPLALAAFSNDKLVACDTHGNLVILQTNTTNKDDYQPKILHNYPAFSNAPDNVTLTYTKGKVINTQLASAMALPSTTGEAKAAIGGRERDIRFLDLETGQCLWKAKNLPPDPQTLMQQPIWPSSMAFLGDDGNNLLAVGTGFGQVRIYDVRSDVRRRPLHYTPEKASSLQHRITAICGVSEHQVVAGDTTGDLHALDLRVHFSGQRYNQHDTTAVTMGRYVGPSGSIRQLKKHPTLPVLAVVGCDRILRTYDTNRQKVLDCVYLKQRLNCVLVCREGRRRRQEEDEDLLFEPQTSGDDVDMDQEDVVEDYVDSDKEDGSDSESESEDNGKAAVSQETGEVEESESEEDEEAAKDDDEDEEDDESASESSSEEEEEEETPRKRRKR